MTINVYGDGYDFTSVTAYEYWRTHAETDLDFTAADFQRRFTDERQHQWFQELRLQSPVDEPMEVNLISSLHWVVGASFFSADLDNETVNEIRPGSPPVFAPVSLYQSARYDLADLGAALFGQGTLEINDQLRLTAGLRYEWERKAADLNLASPLPPATERRSLEDDFDQFLPRFEVAYEWTQRVMTYVSAAKGYRAGGYNRNTLPGGPYSYEEETSWTYESGVKTTWYEGRLRLNAAVFYTDWKDMQLDVPNPLSPVPGAFVLDNVGEARSQGFELEGAAQLTRGWTLFGGLGYVDAEFTDYADPATGANLDGNDLPNVPDVTWHAGLEYRQEVAEQWTWYARGELVGLGDINYDAANGAGENDVLLANLRVGLRRDRWGLEAWVENVTDEVYVPVAIASPFSPSGYAGRPGAPRTFGMGLSYRF
jgi:iron complex outermembrane receptor protein